LEQRADWVDLGRIKQQDSDAPCFRGNLLSEDLKRHRKHAGPKYINEMPSPHVRPQGSGGVMVWQRIDFGKGGVMSALGQKRRFAVQKEMSAITPKANICSAQAHVRFVPIADIDTGAIPIAIAVLLRRAARRNAGFLRD